MPTGLLLILLSAKYCLGMLAQ